MKSFVQIHKPSAVKCPYKPNPPITYNIPQIWTYLVLPWENNQTYKRLVGRWDRVTFQSQKPKQ